jgi:DNA-binding GntR family transcriptional regulator
MTVELVEQLSSQVERYLRFHGEDVVREREAGAEHRAILQAVLDGDVAAARAQIQTHIDHTRRRVIAAITAARPEAR